jgi:Spy/CpxP family protein refolding chaperone
MHLWRQRLIRGAAIVAAATMLVTADLPRANAADAPPASGHEQDYLQLNPDQKQKFAEFETNARGKRDQLFGQLREIHKQLGAVYRQYELDINKAHAINQQLNAVQQQLLQLHLTEQIQLRKILTADQFAKLQAAIQQHRSHDQNWRKHGDREHGDHDWSH